MYRAMKNLLIEQLRIAQEAIKKASEIWDGLSPEDSDAINEVSGYPFRKSLDEVPQDIEDYIKQINNNF